MKKIQQPNFTLMCNKAMNYISVTPHKDCVSWWVSENTTKLADARLLKLPISMDYKSVVETAVSEQLWGFYVGCSTNTLVKSHKDTMPTLDLGPEIPVSKHDRVGRIVSEDKNDPTSGINPLLPTKELGGHKFKQAGYIKAFFGLWAALAIIFSGVALF